MRTLRTPLLPVLGLLSALGGCAKSAPAPGKVVPLESLCNEPDGSQVRVTGHVGYRRTLMSFCSTIGGRKSCDLALYADAEAPPDFDIMKPQTGPEPLHVKLSVPVGDAPGEMNDVPEKFSPSDIVVHLPDQGRAGDGTRITIDGRLSVIPTADAAAIPSCFVYVEWASGA